MRQKRQQRRKNDNTNQREGVKWNWKIPFRNDQNPKGPVDELASLCLKICFNFIDVVLCLATPLD